MVHPAHILKKPKSNFATKLWTANKSIIFLEELTSQPSETLLPSWWLLLNQPSYYKVDWIYFRMLEWLQYLLLLFWNCLCYSAVAPPQKKKSYAFFLNNYRQRKRPESGSIRRAFRQSDSHGLPSSLGEPGPPGAVASSRPSSQPIMSQSLPKEVPDTCSISGHGSLNSLSRHASLKNRIDSPHIRKNVTAGRSKSFNNHRPMDPEVIAQVRKDCQLAFHRSR